MLCNGTFFFGGGIFFSFWFDLLGEGDGDTA